MLFELNMYELYMLNYLKWYTSLDTLVLVLVLSLEGVVRVFKGVRADQWCLRSPTKSWPPQDLILSTSVRETDKKVLDGLSSFV